MPKAGPPAMRKVLCYTQIMRYLYPDTSIWNCLCDQDVGPDALWSRLGGSGIVPVIGFNALYEIAKLFFVGTDEATGRGRELMTYMKGFLALGVPIVKENWALLIEEAMDVAGEKQMESPFRGQNDYQASVRAIDRLLNGEINNGEAQFFGSRKSAARSSRVGMKGHLEARPDLMAVLTKTSDEALPEFLRTASVGPAGQFVLLGHLRAEFPENSVTDLAAVASLLLRSSRYRFSHAMIRSDLYLNWRCANRGSIRSDLPDDTFHVVSAAYSEFFVTTEPDQANIARYSIDGVRAFVCDRGGSVMDQILGETRGQREFIAIER